MSATQMIFADGLMDASVQNGVARLTLGQVGSDGKPVPVGQLCIPLGQLPALASSITTLLKQVEARVKEARPPAAETMPSAFTFGDR